jgi:hypothetical protein
MTEADWIKFKTISEEKFKSSTIQESWGFQIQKDTKWNNGLSNHEIEKLEQHFGFKFPLDYIEMLKAFNGFETLQISIDPRGKEEDIFQRRCYKYPDDLVSTKWLIDDVNQYIKSANGALEEAGFDSTQIEGFVPLYAHRALVVLKDKTKSPVLSIWRNDIIVYGESLIEYWCHELSLEFKN